MNNFDKNLKFTIDTFENSVPHFLDIEICPNGLGIYHKHAQTGQYVHITSYSYGDSHILDSPLIILTTKFNSKKKLSALNEKGQKNMPTKILIRKNKAPFINTF